MQYREQRKFHLCWSYKIASTKEIWTSSFFFFIQVDRGVAEKAQTVSRRSMYVLQRIQELRARRGRRIQLLGQRLGRWSSRDVLLEQEQCIIVERVESRPRMRMGCGESYYGAEHFCSSIILDRSGYRLLNVSCITFLIRDSGSNLRKEHSERTTISSINVHPGSK